MSYSCDDNEVEICSCRECGTIYRVEWTRSPGFSDHETLYCSVRGCEGIVFNSRCDWLTKFDMVREYRVA